MIEHTQVHYVNCEEARRHTREHKIHRTTQVELLQETTLSRDRVELQTLSEVIGNNTPHDNNILKWK
ncbi:hypothetical protein J6590_090067 [Homalodisca vitripennis]|nr:hypothetical protein J6590_090067 [Homalodisca vitripennis]